MNVFENLGLPANHRPSSKVVQLVRNFDDRLKQLEKHFSEGGVVYGQIKYDGVYAMAVVRARQEFVIPSCIIYGRTGKKLNNVGWLERDFEMWSNHENMCGVLIFELICDGLSLEEISGVVNPDRVNPVDSDKLSHFICNARVAIHDLVSIPELAYGRTSTCYHDRYYTLKSCGIDGYISGLIVKSHELSCVHECQEFAQMCINKGHEGAVFKMPDSGWVAGRKNEVATKIVRGVDYDLLVTGVEYGKAGTKRAGTISKLLVRWRDYGDVFGKRRTLPVDLSGFADSVRAEWAYNPELILGKIVHVHALQVGSKGSLRLPKVKAIRIDKDTPDL